MRLFSILCVLISIKESVRLCDSVPLNSSINPKDTNKDNDIKSFRESFVQRMKSYMNTSVDPCDDFYEYACGNYPNVIEENEITRKQNVLNDLSHQVDAFVDRILQKDRKEDELYYEELQTVKKYLEICDNATLWPPEPSEEYLEVLRSIGGFPAIYSNWNSSSFDWFNMTSHLIRYGVDGLIREEIFLKHPFPPYYEIPRFGFDFDVYSDNIQTNKSLGYSHNVQVMKEILELYGVNETRINEVIKDVIEFWKEALVYQEKALDRRSCHVVTFEENLDEYEFPKWNFLFEIAWKPNDSSIFEDCECPCDWYFLKLDKISANRSEAIANYMAMKFLYKMHAQLKSTKFQHQYCLNHVKRSVPIILTHFYMKEHFSIEDKTEVKEMISEIKASFAKLIESSDWLDDDSRSGNLMNINTLKYEVGEVVDPVSDTYIKEINSLNLTESYALNNLRMMRFRVDLRHYAFLNQNLSENTAPLEVLNAIQVNAFYDLINHRINVLAGILFPPAYHKNLPKFVKYSTLGYIVGHEIVHSLEYRGRAYEKLFKNYSAWTNEAVEVMHNRSQCFANQQMNYLVPLIEEKVNRSKSTRESIADAGGLRHAFYTYQTSYNKINLKNEINDFESTEYLPNLDLTPEKKFFLSFAQLYCAKYEAKHYWSEINEYHPMDRYRVLSSLQNFEEFSKTYNCSLGSSMNPKLKCRLW